MASLTSKELLDYLLEGHALKPDQLDEFMQENPEENQYFDYKVRSNYHIPPNYVVEP